MRINVEINTLEEAFTRCISYKTSNAKDLEATFAEITAIYKSKEADTDEDYIFTDTMRAFVKFSDVTELDDSTKELLGLDIDEELYIINLES